MRDLTKLHYVVYHSHTVMLSNYLSSMKIKSTSLNIKTSNFHCGWLSLIWSSIHCEKLAWILVKYISQGSQTSPKFLIPVSSALNGVTVRYFHFVSGWKDFALGIEWFWRCFLFDFERFHFVVYLKLLQLRKIFFLFIFHLWLYFDSSVDTPPPTQTLCIYTHTQAHMEEKY